MSQTTLQNIMQFLQRSGVLPAAQVNFGYTDALKPPYACVTSYSHEIERDTGSGLRECRFTLLSIGKNIDEAENTAKAFDDLLDKSETVTPQTAGQGCLQESWESGRVSPDNLYQSGTRVEYLLFEDPSK